MHRQGRISIYATSEGEEADIRCVGVCHGSRRLAFPGLPKYRRPVRSRRHHECISFSVIGHWHRLQQRPPDADTLRLDGIANRIRLHARGQRGIAHGSRTRMGGEAAQRTGSGSCSVRRWRNVVRRFSRGIKHRRCTPPADRIHMPQQSVRHLAAPRHAKQPRRPSPSRPKLMDSKGFKSTVTMRLRFMRPRSKHSQKRAQGTVRPSSKPSLTVLDRTPPRMTLAGIAATNRFAPGASAIVSTIFANILKVSPCGMLIVIPLSAKSSATKSIAVSKVHPKSPLPRSRVYSPTFMRRFHGN